MGISAGSAVRKLMRDVEPERMWRAAISELVSWGIAAKAARSFVHAREQIDLGKVGMALARSGLRFLAIRTGWYPSEFYHLESPPAGLFVRASDDAVEKMLTLPRMTVVGTRKATPEGLHVAESFSRELSDRGVAVVSGMAIGIDAQVHRSALEGGGFTVAILGCGADVVYPRCHHWLYRRIAESGVVASELPPGSQPTRWTFPYRNRLLAALGDAVTVVQGSNTSGALQTAKWALELGRPVFSVPGSILSTASEGCNTLLYEGAAPAIRAEIMVEDFLQQTRIERGERIEPDKDVHAGSQQKTGRQWRAVDSRQRRVLDALEVGPATGDRLVELTGLTVRDVGVALGELEAAGKVVRGGPGLYLQAQRER